MQTKKKGIIVIGEAGVNHNGSLKLAHELVDVAIAAQADIVKFQSFRTESLVSKFAPKAQYQLETTSRSESQFQMLKKLEHSFSDKKKLWDYCLKKSIQFLSTPFDLESLDFLVKDLKVELLKIASSDITNALLLLKAARSGVPMILSTGMSTLGEIEDALGVLAFGYLKLNEAPSLKGFREAYWSMKGREVLFKKVTLLHCVADYPAPFEQVNLRAMKSLAKIFGLRTGYSDHTEGLAVALASAALGAQIIEKHFTLSRKMKGPDHRASIEPGELVNLVRGIRQVEMALGLSTKVPGPSEVRNRPVARKSVVAGTIIKKGEIFSERNLSVKRPGSGNNPTEYWAMIGQRSIRDFAEDEVIDNISKQA